MASKKIMAYTIKEHHLDVLGHVNNATVLEILEECRWDLGALRGYTLQTMRDSGVGPVILEIQIRYKKELLNRQQIEIHTTAFPTESKIGTIEQKIFREGEVCVIAEFKYGMLDLKKRCLVELTDDWKDAMGLELTKSV